MALDRKTVEHIAFLARIEVPTQALDGLAAELSNILGWVEQLAEVATDDVQPMTSVVDVRLPMRDDAVTDGGCREDVLADAPEVAGGFFAVPKVVE